MAIKAKELMIGNLLLNGSEVVRVWSMENPLQFTVEDKEFSTFGGNYFQPIPLTEEWLIRFGFECKDKVNGGYVIPINYDWQGEYLYCSKQGVIALWNERENRDFIIINNCNSIHQLQNLYFALTGEELTLKY